MRVGKKSRSPLNRKEGQIIKPESMWDFVQGKGERKCFNRLAVVEWPLGRPRV